MARKRQTNLVQVAYEELKKRIISMHHLPGENLLEEELKEVLKVSRTPIRIALGKLEQEGFVYHRPGQGYLVREIKLNDVVNLFQVREYLEVPATRLAAENGSQKELADLQHLWVITNKALEQHDFETYITAGVEFHYRIAIMSRNKLLCKMIKDLNEHLSIVSRILIQYEKRLTKSHQEHKAIVDKLIEGDADGAAEVARQHVVQSRNEILQLLQAKTELLSVSPLRGFHSTSYSE